MFFNLAMWFGLAVGYMYHFGFFSWVELGANSATKIESCWPFRVFKEKPYFITAGRAMGGSILPSFNARENSTAAASSNTVTSKFKAFGGKGYEIGGEPVTVPLIQDTGASASRARSTPETRATAASESSG